MKKEYVKTKYEELEVYQLADSLSDMVWDIVIEWGHFAKDTVGKQLVRSSDSIGANIAEGSGRGSYSDYGRFIKIARGSLFESKHWLKKALKRKLITKKIFDEMESLINELIPRLSAFVNYLNKRSNSIK